METEAHTTLTAKDVNLSVPTPDGMMAVVSTSRSFFTCHAYDVSVYNLPWSINKTYSLSTHI